MKRILFLLPGFAFVSVACGQGGFKTLVSPERVVAGEGFRVQYVVEDAEGVSGFSAGRFDPFVVVKGPEMYTGFTSNGKTTTRSQNYVYTLVARQPGLFTIRGAKITINGQTRTSNDVLVKVADAKESKAADVDDAGFLRPGEDVQEKIRKNIFLKVRVDKKSCFVGQPVVATFQLYSRLRSKSELVKNPGFYGFSVYDMVNLASREKETITVNGHLFDVHTLRKVQLYPLQPGRFTIDPMELSNKISFSRSQVSRKTEPEVVEQMVGANEEEEPAAGDEEVVETTLASEPVLVEVKPLPAVKPDSFNGATGVFTIKVVLEKKQLARNEQGFLRVEIQGKGNFIQLTAPGIQWPAGIEGFDATVKDSLDKETVPLSGQRVFRYGFVAEKPGRYQIPSLRFSFFNTDSNRYVTVQTAPAEVEFTTETMTVKAEAGVPGEAEPAQIGWWIIFLLPLLAVPGLWWWQKYKRKGEKKAVSDTPTEAEDAQADLLFRAERCLNTGHASFFRELELACRNFLQKRYELSGSALHKTVLLNRPVCDEEKKVLVRWLGIMETCEAEMYTGVQGAADKQALLGEARELLRLWEKMPLS